uniref:VTT domain-containing protein n=1 Tax=Kalanchoe fedtschenkoi TaxID=63787 RepID=A0A7N0ZTQ8_KALFE
MGENGREAAEAMRKVENGGVGGANYVRLESSDDGDVRVDDVITQSPNDTYWWWLRWCWRWWKTILLAAVIGVLIWVVIKWAGPFFMEKEIIPIINWETKTFSDPVLAVLIFATIALFPVVFFPSTPSMWVAGMTFGYGIGFLLAIAGVAVGVSLPFFIGSRFLHKVQNWLERHPEKASIVRLAGDGNWFHQFQSIVLIRISPFPYVVFNYAAVATHVSYFPYLCGSVVGMVPEVFVGLYSGIVIRTLADATQDHTDISKTQMILNVVGIIGMVCATIIIGIFAKRKLDKLRQEQILVE